MSDRDDFAGKWFWLCGASSGIGYAVAEILAGSGARLIVMSSNAGKLESAAASLKAKGAVEIITAAFDIADKTTSQAVRKIVGDRQLAGILLNGGGPHGGGVNTLSWEDYESANRLLLAGPASLLSALIPNMQAPGGSVVAITSATVKQPIPNLPLSAAYRAGLVALLKSFADELGAKGVRFNNVAPGYTATDRLNELAAYLAGLKHGADTPDNRQKVLGEWADTSSLKRLAEPREIAEACVFLLSSRSSFVTGQTIIADGGFVRGY